MRGADIDTTMLVMIGAWIVMQNTEMLAWGGVAKAVVTPFPEVPLVIGPVSVSYLRIFVLAMALSLIAATYIMIKQDEARKSDAGDFPGSRHGRADGCQHQRHLHRDLRHWLGACRRGRRVARAGFLDRRPLWAISPR